MDFNFQHLSVSSGSNTSPSSPSSPSSNLENYLSLLTQELKLKPVSSLCEADDKLYQDVARAVVECKVRRLNGDSDVTQNGNKEKRKEQQHEEQQQEQQQQEQQQQEEVRNGSASPPLTNSSSLAAAHRLTLLRHDIPRRIQIHNSLQTSRLLSSSKPFPTPRRPSLIQLRRRLLLRKLHQQTLQHRSRRPSPRQEEVQEKSSPTPRRNRPRIRHIKNRH